MRSLALLVLFVFSQMYALGHHSFVRHHGADVPGALCCSHGGERVSDTTAAISSDSARDESHEEGPSLKGWDSDRLTLERCHVPASRDLRSLPPVRVWLSPAGMGQEDIRVEHSSQVFGMSIPLYRLAPKQSPPQLG